MPRLFRSLAAALAAALIFALFPVSAFADSDPWQPFGAADLNAAILVDDDTGEILFEQNAREKCYPASTTKMLTALMVIEAVEQGKIHLDDVVVCQRKLVDSVLWDASHVSPRVKADEEFTVEQLLHCVLIESDCAVCNILADYVDGSVDAFVKRMNARAAELGCVDTNFVNTHGYPDPNHWTTAYSLYLIASEAMKHPDFARIVSTREYTIPKTKLTRARKLVNTNWLLGSPSDTDVKYDADYYYEYCVGIKTGYSSAAGSCLASCSKKDGRTLICIVLGAQGLKLKDGTTRRRSFSESIRLFDWGFSNYSDHTFLTTSDEVGSVAVVGGGKHTDVALRPAGDLSAMLPNGMTYRDMDYDVEYYADSVGVPVEKGTELGMIRFIRDDRVIGETPLVAAEYIPVPTKVDLLMLRLNTSALTAKLLIANGVMLLFCALIAVGAAASRRKAREREAAAYAARAAQAQTTRRRPSPAPAPAPAPVRRSNYDRGYDRGYDRDYDRGYDRDYDRGYGDRSYDRGYDDRPRRRGGYDAYDSYDSRDAYSSRDSYSSRGRAPQAPTSGGGRFHSRDSRWS